MKKYFFVLILLPGNITYAQERLTLQMAIEKVLKHNFDINIADLAAQQVTRNNTWGNAGATPNVLLSASATGSKSNTHNDLASGAVQDNPKAQSVNYNPNLLVTWTLFDGGKMFLLKKELSEFAKIGEIQLKAQVTTMVSRTIQMYSQAVLLNRQQVAIDTALTLAKTRMDISDLKFTTGAGPKVDYLQARVDYNARESDSLNQQASLTVALDSLCVLMGEPEDKIYMLDDSMELNTRLEPIDKPMLMDVNLNLAVFKGNAQISKMNEKIAKTYFWPNLSFNGGYSYSQTTNATGFSLYSRSYGPNGTFTLNMPVFEGGNLRRQARVATLQTMRDELLYERQTTIVGKQYRNAWRNYEVSVVAYKLESENIKYAKENLNVQLARFRVGVGTTLEARQAENDYITALETLYTSEYNLKVNETIVLELENKLVK